VPRFRCVPVPTETALRFRRTGVDDRGNALENGRQGHAHDPSIIRRRIGGRGVTSSVRRLGQIVERPGGANQAARGRAQRSPMPGIALCVGIALTARLLQALEERILGHPYLEGLVLAILLGMPAGDAGRLRVPAPAPGPVGALGGAARR